VLPGPCRGGWDGIRCQVTGSGSSWSRSNARDEVAAANLTDRDDDVNRDTGPTVGASDAEADAARSDLDDADLDDAGRDSDGVPVGSADAEADAENSGADRG
jgi:hypothetical protein